MRRASLIAIAGMLGATTLSGCAAVGFLGALEESRRRNSTRPIDAEYLGLEGRTFAVVVSTDRSVQADHPGLVERITAGVTDRLAAEEVGATGVVPPERVLRFQYENPRWVAMTPLELAKTFGVDRLIYIDLQEYRLNDPGNQYLWEGMATGQLGVLEADSLLSDEFMFTKLIQVDFPDKSGLGPAELSAQVVTSELSRRFIDRASWLFYLHQEPYYPEY